jgi:glycosyltransferase involved in cell wall biosynthesis
VRIAQVITLFRPDFVGGATLACERLARGLAARGHEVAVFCGRPDADAEPYGEREWSVAGIPVTGVNAAPGYAALDPRSYRHPEVLPVFLRFLERRRPEVVHFHSLQALGADLLAAAAARGVPVVVTAHDWWWVCARLFLVDGAGYVCPPRVESRRCHCAPGFDLVARRRHLDAALRHACRVLAPSRVLADALVANGVPRARVEVCPNGVDLPRARAARRPGPVRFGYFGGPDNRLKGLPTLLAAAAELDAGGWELVLHAVPPGTVAVPPVVGDRVRPAPAFPPARLADVLAALDCLIVPSLMRESYSLAAREALAAGLAVVASDAGGPAEVVRPGTNGLLFPTGDAGALACCMRRLVLEPGLLERLRAGAAATEVPAVAAQVEQVERVYAAVAARGPAAAPGRLPPAGAGVAAGAAPAAAPAARTARLPRRALFVAGIDGAPLRYRVRNLQDQLRLLGVASRVLAHTDPALPEAIAASDLVVLYRVPMGRYVRACLAHARRLGRRLVFSCDDLIFDPAAVPSAALATLPEGQRAGWLAHVARYADTLAACDAFVGSTEPLAAAAERLGARAFVVRNGLGEAQLAAAEETRKRAVPGRDGRVRLAYVSGTTMHDLDFAAVEPALVRVLAARPEVVLRLVGYLRAGPALAAFGDRLERLPFLPWPELFACLAEVDVNLAPLARPDPFSDAKSAVKYLEAAVMGVPTVATPTAAFRHAIRDGLNGLLAADGAAWRSALLRLAADPALRRLLGNAARDDAFLHYTPAVQAESLAAVLDAILAEDPRPPVPGVPPDDPESLAPPLHLRFPGEAGRGDLEPEDALPGTAQPARDTPSPFLLAGRAVGQVFRARADRLSRVDLCVGTDGRVNPHRLIVHLSDRPGRGARELARVVLDAATLADHAWVAVEIPPVAESAGRDLYLWVESEGAAEGNAVTLWTYVRGWGEGAPRGLHLDHAPAPGSLTFRTFHLAGD